MIEGLRKYNFYPKPIIMEIHNIGLDTYLFARPGRRKEHLVWSVSHVPSGAGK